MEEQPHEGPAEPPADASDERPKIFKNINGWIAGVTGAVIALGGLATAVKQFMPDKPATEQGASAAPADTATAELDNLPLATPISVEPGTLISASDRPKIYTGDLYANGKFEGGAMSLKYDGENWILTADQRYIYEPLASSNRGQIRAYNKEYDSYLSWPVDGGEVEESTDNKVSWSDYAKVTASEPSPAK
jgi:hypothetical protein